MSVHIVNCPRVYQCWICRKERDRAVVASIRAFAGIYGGGYPACERHAPKVISIALNVLLSKDIDPSTFEVDVFPVVDDGRGYPKLGPKLFTAKRRGFM